jgi:hypothetical protein
MPNTEDSEATIVMQKLELRSPSPVPKQASPIATEGCVKGSKSSPRRMQRSAEKPVEAVKRRASTLGDKKLNPEFFQKIAARDSDDWQIEVVVPRSSSQMSNHEEVCVRDEIAIVDEALMESATKEEKQEGCVVPTVFPSAADKTQCSRTVENIAIEKDSGKAEVWDGNDHATGLLSTSSLESNNGRSAWVFMEERICQLEQQQSSLLQMFQVNFYLDSLSVIISSQYNLIKLFLYYELAAVCVLQSFHPPEFRHTQSFFSIPYQNFKPQSFSPWPSETPLGIDYAKCKSKKK